MSKCYWIGKYNGRFNSKITDVPECIADEIGMIVREEFIELLNDLYGDWSIDYCPWCGREIYIEEE